MSKKIFYDEDARRRVLGGAKTLYDAVKTTMGPKGRNVVIGKGYGGPQVTHDGVTVAKAIEIPDVDDETLGYKVGAELIKEAANKMNDVAGDGTTTVTVLTYRILSEANKLIAAGHNPMELRKGLEAAAQDVVKQLSGLSEDITNKPARVAEIATISAGDAEIGKKIAGVIAKVGKDGAVTVEEGQGLGLEDEIVHGFTFDKGFVSAYMVTDTARMEAVVQDPAIILTDKKVSTIQEILPLLEKLTEKGKKDIVLIAEDVEGEALTALVLNRLKGVLNVVAVKAPSFGDRRKDILGDIATLTGAEVISDDTNLTFENATIESCGRAKKVIVAKDETTIIDPKAGKDALTNVRVAEIAAQIETATSDYDKENLEARRAALNGKVAVIKVGGATETEINEKKDRVDDAVHAVKAALDEGIVAGGGVTFVDLSKTIVATNPGAGILKEALLHPFRQLMYNAGHNQEALLEKVLESKKPGQGFDVNKAAKLIDVKSAGIVDPARVSREAILNAVSIAGTSMTMGALVVDVPEKNSPAAPDMGGMGGF